MKLTRNRIARFRNKIAMTQGDLARTLGVSRTTAYCWEHGLYQPMPAMQLKIIEFFGASREELFTYQDYC